eukprot:CAMPEP_0185570010 /NCGR_PEP_ID=MMETSP0434-20130131/2464_1 /TAXON_ID=626734 ORGANISM="Favella taraikaensis, Strain Fe Narragansett Bay" /NCGR_SAMPLE_ID=MMETSP0434 /ASSEMBLY_ACC=CAM_ASM_000379 /LENGTH=68 /DNA_ID=CAMNT_0028184999 /DNA_START=2114 /DNA_END=2320 /DNA_ORIENTATION=-
MPYRASMVGSLASDVKQSQTKSLASQPQQPMQSNGRKKRGGLKYIRKSASRRAKSPFDDLSKESSLEA